MIIEFSTIKNYLKHPIIEKLDCLSIDELEKSIKKWKVDGPPPIKELWQWQHKDRRKL